MKICNTCAKKKNTLVSDNAGNGKNLYPGSGKFIFLTKLIDSNGIRTHNHLIRKWTSYSCSQTDQLKSEDSFWNGYLTW